VSDLDKKEPKVPRSETRAGAQVDPVPKVQEFFEWMEKLFDGSTQFPEKIHVCVVTGKNFEQLRSTIKQIVYGPKEPKPSKERIVALSNELMFLMQRDCDVQRRQVVYGVHASHFSRDPDYYERWIVRCHPKTVHAHDGEPREPDDDVEQPTIVERFGTQVLGHQERMVGLLGAGFEGMLDRDDRTIDRLLKRIAELEDRLEKKNDQLERALSMEMEREERRQWNALKIRGAEKGLDMALSMAPPMINQILGKRVVPTIDSPEAIALRNFFKPKEDGGLLTQEQSDAAFGAYDQSHNLTRPGVLSLDQARLLFEVAQCRVPVDELDRLMPATGGPLAITQEQIAGLGQCGFSMDQLAPLLLIFETRQRRRAVG
jgi:hypothetical protein